MKITDLHNDYLTELNSKQAIKYIDNNISYIDNLFSPIWTTKLKNPLNYIKSKQNLIKNSNFLNKLHICIEDMYFFDDCMQNEILNINPYYCGLCWNYENKFCGGAYSTASLSNKGKRLIKFLEDNNIQIDCAHMNEKSFYQFASVTTKPIFCSHTGFKCVVDDNRNLSDEQIKQIIKSKGIIGFYFVGKYISKNKISIFDIANNIENFVNLYGIEHLAIGSDFYGTNDLPHNLQNYNHFKNLEDELIKHDFTDCEIKKIFYKNANKFTKKNIS